MGNQTYRGVIKGGSVVLLETTAPLPDGTHVLVTPMDPQPGSAEAVLAAMAAEPHLTKEDVELLERSIEEGKRRFERNRTRRKAPPKDDETS
jgi:hypothetical protein